MKKNVLKTMIISSLVLLSGCGVNSSNSNTASNGVSSSIKATLPAVTNVKFEDGIISFDAVEGAEGYKIKFTQNGELLYEDKISETTIDTESLGFEGEIEFEVSAYAGDEVGVTSKLTFVALSVFGDVIFEAEDYLANYGTGKAQCNYRNNPSAHNGAYVGGIDDAGQGIYINYLCPVAGTFTFECWYTTDMPVAHDDVWVNGVFQARYDFTEKTGWGGATYEAAKAEVQITLEQGWNTIAVYKNGDSSDNWGSFVELDYFVLKGDGSKYNSSELKTFGETPEWFRLEAEMGSPRRKNVGSGTYECKNPAIVEKNGKKFSNGFILGNIENNYDGVEWQFHSEVKGKYEVKIAYAAGQFEGSKPAAPSFVTTQTEVGLTRNVDFLDYDIKTIENLPYSNWDDIVVAEQTVEIELEQGKNFIYCLLLDKVNCGIFQIDYIDIRLVEEL